DVPSLIQKPSPVAVRQWVVKSPVRRSGRKGREPGFATDGFDQVDLPSSGEIFTRGRASGPNEAMAVRRAGGSPSRVLLVTILARSAGASRNGTREMNSPAPLPASLSAKAASRP